MNMKNLINETIGGVIESATNNNSNMKIGVYSLSYCGGCNYMKTLLDKAEIPYFDYQLNNPEAGGLNQDKSEEFNNFTKLYDTKSTVPKIVALDDKLLNISQEFDHCADQGNLSGCIETFINGYNSFTL